MRLTIKRTIALAATIAVVALVWRSDYLLFEAPQDLADSAYKSVGRRLSKKENICFAVDFGEARPRERISNLTINAPGTDVARSSKGFVRRFKGDKYSYAETPLPWAIFGDNYSLSIWLRLKKSKLPQAICYSNFAHQETGLRLVDGMMRLYIPQRDGASKMISYEFDSYKRFINLLAVVDSDAGEARLYENGMLKGKVELGPVSLPHHNIEFGKFRWYAVNEPFSGQLKEAVGWRKALTAREVAKVSHSHIASCWRCAPLRQLGWKICDASRNVTSTILKMIDRFNPSLHSRALVKANLPEVNLIFSRRDSRHFINGHDRSLAAGRRIRAAAKPRGVMAQVAGANSAALLRLDGSDTFYPSSKRPSYILELTNGATMRGYKKIRLIPPETLGDQLAKLLVAQRDGERWIPSKNLCRLSINGIPKGAYYFEDYERHGVNAISREKIFPAYIDAGSWFSLFEQRPWLADYSEAIGSEEGEEGFEQLRALLSHDLFHPWSAREWRWHIKEAMLLLPARSVAERLQMDQIGAAPARRGLPVLQIYVPERLAYTRRVEFSAYYYPAVTNSVPLILTGSQAHNSGIRYRGNTSFWRGVKKPLSLKFDEAAELVEDRTSRHLYLLSGYSDSTKLRNRLAYDTFRSWGGPDNPRYAPQIEWAEVFLNGHYIGIYELCTRIDGELLGYDIAPNRQGSTLYKIRPDPMLFAAPETHAYNQVYPRPKKTVVPEPLQELMAFASQSTTAEFRAQVANRIDLRNAVDFLILLNFTQNVDGRYANFNLARDGDANAPFFFIPWDYDHTFADGHLWLSNYLFDRLLDEVPEFVEMLRKRWHELRQTSLREDNVKAQIDSLAQNLAPLMEDEYAVVKKSGVLDYAAEVAKLQQAASENLKTLDLRWGSQ